MSTWYRVGTVAVTNGSPDIVGTGTLWLTQASVGDILIGPDLALYEITAITDDTHLAVKKLNGTAAYNGGTASAQAYAIIRNFTSTLPAQLAADLAALQAKYHVTLDDLIAWLNGTGSVTVHDAAGNAHTLQTPASLVAAQAGRLVKSVAGSSAVTLNSAESSNMVMEFTGTLTGNITVYMAPGVGQKLILNNTSGAYSLTFSATGGSGLVILQGKRAVVECDGTNIVNPIDFIPGSLTLNSTFTSGAASISPGGVTSPIRLDKATTGSYGMLSFNNNMSVSAGLGVFGGDGGDATNLYLQAPSGGSVTSRVGGTAVTTVNSSGITVAGTATVTGDVSANGSIYSQTALRASRAGSNTFGAGPYLYVSNAAASAGIVQQLNAANGLDYWDAASASAPIAKLYTNGEFATNNNHSAGPRGSVGSHLLTNIGTPAGFRIGLGGNLRNDGTNWKIETDGGSNAAFGVLMNYGDSTLRQFVIATTGGTARTISDATLAGYEVSRIDPSGVLTLPSASAGLRIPTNTGGTLIQATTADHTQIHATGTSYGGGAAPLILSGDPAASTNWCFVRGMANWAGTPTTVFQVYGNGNVQNTNNSYAAISDVKLKQDIVDAKSQWEDIKGLRVRKYRFKNDPTAPLQMGLVAQEAELVSPGLIETTEDFETFVTPAVKGTRFVKRQKTEMVTKHRNEVKLLDGKYVNVLMPYEEQEPVFEQHPVFDEDGSPVMIGGEQKMQPVLDEDGEPLVVDGVEQMEPVLGVDGKPVLINQIQQMHEVPVMETIEEEYEVAPEKRERVATGESTKSVKYSVLYMKAVKALQEAMERIEALEVKVEALEAA